MNEEINYKANPLHGLSLKNLLIEITNYYGFDILFAYLKINCFKTNPSIESSVKFLKKTQWAREKVESFTYINLKTYLGHLNDSLNCPLGYRIIPEDQITREPAGLSLEDAARLLEKRANRAAERMRNY